MLCIQYNMYILDRYNLLPRAHNITFCVGIPFCVGIISFWFGVTVEFVASES